MIDFKMTDLDGRWRHITIPTERFNDDIFVYGIGREENTPFDQYPRNISLRAVEYMRSEQIADEMMIGPEFEFHYI